MMFTKLLVLIVLVTAIAATLLGLRHHQLEMMHRSAALHREMDLSRQKMWQLQAYIAEQLEPGHLEESLAHLPLELEPVVAPGTMPDLLAEVAMGRGSAEEWGTP